MGFTVYFIGSAARIFVFKDNETGAQSNCERENNSLTHLIPSIWPPIKNAASIVRKKEDEFGRYFPPRPFRNGKMLQKCKYSSSFIYFSFYDYVK